MIPYHAYKFIKLGSIIVRTHLLLMLLGILVFIIFFAISSIKKKKDPTHTFILSLLIIIGVWVGSKLFHVLFHLDTYSHNISGIFDLSGGFASFGGVAFAILLCFLYVKFYHLKFFEWGDIGAPYAPLISLFTRVGCFLNGCCYGIPTSLPWGIKHLGAVRHPTQIYHVIAASIAFLVLSRLKTKKRFTGFLFLTYLIMYFTERFIIDFFRYYKSEYYTFSLTKFQWTSLAVIILCIFIFYKNSNIIKRQTNIWKKI